MTSNGLSWISIVRLGLVQTALGAIVVLTTSTINRVMIVELAMPAMLPGALVAIHYMIQILRPRWGHGSDVGGRRAPWIIGGMAILALGATMAAGATAWMEVQTMAGVGLSLVAFILIGIGVGASGTSLLALLAAEVAPERRAAAATIVWLMMIAGMAVTAATAGSFLDPFTTTRLIVVTATVATMAIALTSLAVLGIESKARAGGAAAPVKPQEELAFMTALRDVWNDPKARRFGIFVFVSMLAFSAQDLILEPFAGLVFGLTPGESTRLSGVQHSGVLLGMILVAIAGSTRVGRQIASLRTWTAGGCVASAVALFILVAGGYIGPGFPLKPAVFFLGFSNGIFAVAAIGSMMGLAGDGPQGREGIRMGFWGAAQAIAFGLGGFVGTAGVDLARAIVGSPAIAYTSVFAAEALMFLLAAFLAARLDHAPQDQSSQLARGRSLAAGATGR